jgi:hypothetical protein
MLSPTEHNQWITEANGYFKAATGGLNRKEIFTNEILYNIISMSIEKYLMGFLVSRNQLPQCHTLSNMIQEVKALTPVSDYIVQKMNYFDKVQQICSLVNYDKTIITDKDILVMINLLKEIKVMVQENIDAKVAKSLLN